MPDKEESRAALQAFMEASEFLEVEASAFDNVTEYDIEYQVVPGDGENIDADDLGHAQEIKSLIGGKIQSRMVYLASWEDEPE